MKKLSIIILFLAMVGCKNQSQGKKLSGDDPFFLGLNDVSLACRGSEAQEITHLELADSMDRLLSKYYDGRKFSYEA